MGRKNIQTERRKQILEALHQCLLKKPFDKTSIKDIAQEAKINHGMLHYYFKNKEDILLNYIEYIIHFYQSLFDEWLKSEGLSYSDSKDFVRGAFDFMFQKITLNQDMAKIYIEIWEIAVYNEKVKSKLRLDRGCGMVRSGMTVGRRGQPTNSIAQLASASAISRIGHLLHGQIAFVQPVAPSSEGRQGDGIDE